MTLHPTPLLPGIYTDITAFAANQHYILADKVRFENGLPWTMGGCGKYNAAVTFDGVPRTLRQWVQLDGTFTIGCGGHKKVELLIGSTKSDVTPYAYIVTGSLTNKFTTTASSATVSVNHVAHGRAIGDIAEYPNAGTLDGIDLGKFAVEVVAITDPDNYTFTAYTTATGSTGGGGGTVTYNYNSKIMANNPFTTTTGSATVVVTDVAHGLSTGATVTFSGAVAFNSVTPNGTWAITKITVDSYSFTYTGLATGTGGGGGAVARIFRCIDIGSPTGTSMRIPSLQNWGEDLLFTLGHQSRVYVWKASLGVAKRARAIPRAPLCNFITVSVDDESLIMFGCSGDDLDIVWSAQADYTTVLAAATNTAGEKRVIRGSKLVAALATGGGSLVFTDTAVHGMQFTGGAFVFSINFIAKTKILGPNAACERNGIVEWAGGNNFYRFDGRVTTHKCTVRKYVFDNISATEKIGTVAGILENFGEAIFFYPSASATNNDRYALLDLDDTENMPWSIGTWARTAWSDSDIYDYPLALDFSGNLFKHEYGTSDDGVPMSSYLETGDIQPDPSGDHFHIGKRVVMDMVLNGNVNFQIKARETQASSYRYYGPLLMLTTDTDAFLRWRGRRMGYIWSTPTYALEELETETLLIDLITTEAGETILCDGVAKDQTLNLATTWRLGVQSPDIRPDGSR